MSRDKQRLADYLAHILEAIGRIHRPPPGTVGPAKVVVDLPLQADPGLYVVK